MQTVADTTTFINSSPLYRLFLGFLTPVFGLFDDYWFYIYHQNSFKGLEILPNILVFMYIVNGQRILPDYLSMPEDLTIEAFSQSQYYENYTSERILLIDENMTYLEQNFEPLIFEQYLFQLIVFVLIAFLVKVLKKCAQKPKESIPNLTIKNKVFQQHQESGVTEAKSYKTSDQNELKSHVTLMSVLKS